ncbi:MAG: hypothetical protein ACLP01_26295 [Solirubrobacteraceae bacterium]
MPTIVVLVAGLAVGAGVAFFTVRDLMDGVKEITDWLEKATVVGAGRLKDGLEALAQGDLTHELPITTSAITDFAGDELGHVMRTFEDLRAAIVACYGAYNYNTTCSNLRGLIGDVTSTAGSVGAASTEMASTSDEVGRAVGEIATAISDMAHGEERTAAFAEHVSQDAEKRKHITGEVFNVAEQASASAEQISAATEQTSASAQQIAASAQELAGSAKKLNQLVVRFRVAS